MELLSDEKPVTQCKRGKPVIAMTWHVSWLLHHAQNSLCLVLYCGSSILPAELPRELGRYIQYSV